MKRVTVAAMVYADGQKAVYAVFHAMLHEGKKSYWDMNDPRSVEVAQVVKNSADTPRFNSGRFILGKFYYDMAAPFACTEWPAFAFGYAPPAPGTPEPALWPVGRVQTP